jgi:hypothetical protein
MKKIEAKLEKEKEPDPEPEKEWINETDAERLCNEDDVEKHPK